jgi:trk system potassium uptake protein TrkA
MEIVTPAKWAGSTLAELNVRRRFGISILAIHRDDSYIISPTADTQLADGETLLVLGKQEDLDFLNE